tara:strand:+ start:54 stop:620 length:567 start_codon:yes stop_codon:yes gene_type:complete
MIETEIIDNFLDRKEFETISFNMGLMGGEDSCFRFPWYWEDDIAYDPEDSQTQYHNDIISGQLCHLFKHGLPYKKDSPHLDLLNPIMRVLNPLMIFRIKANLQPRVSKTERQITPWHRDVDIGNKLKDEITTCIFYMNTNNGYTELKDGTKIESVENRFVKFSNSLFHRGTTCTDVKKRVLINFNFIL